VVNGSGTIQINAATADFAAAVSQTVSFGSSGVLELGDAQAFAGKISGFSHTGTTSLDLGDIAFVSGTTTVSFTGTTASGILAVTDGAHTAKFTLLGNYTKSTFTLSSDGHGGTTVTDPAAAPLTHAMASFQVGPPPHLAGTPAWRLPRLPILHVQA
jgi:hypothetical protein